MPHSHKPIIISLLTIALGVAWLLNVIGVMPGIDWIWTLGLGIVGLVTLLAGSLNRFSFVAGLFLIKVSVLSVLRQTGRISMNIEVPVLVIVFGVLTLAAELLKLPLPAWIRAEEQSSASHRNG